MSKLQERLKGCPVEALLKILGQRWNAYVLHVLLVNGPLRFGSLRKHIPGIAQKVLTEKLRELERAAIVYRDYVPTVPPQVSYGLTKRGLELSPILITISNVAHQWRENGYL